MKLSFSVTRQPDGTFTTIGDRTNQDRLPVTAVSESVMVVLTEIRLAFTEAINSLESGQTATLTVSFVKNPPE